MSDWKFQQFTPPGARGKYREELLTDLNWIAEEKYDGDRRVAQFCGEKVRFTGRRISKKDGLLVEKTENLPHLHNICPASLVGTVLDGEIVCADPGARSRDVTSIMGSLPDEAIRKQVERGWLQFAAFDVLFYKGMDVRAYNWSARRIMLDHAMVEWASPFAFAVPFRDQNKAAFLDEIWARGGEGIILKNSMAAYGIEKEWVKVKREETYDVVVMGFEEAKAESTKVDGTVSPTKYAGMVGAVRFGQYVQHTGPEGAYYSTLEECGRSSGFDDSYRLDMTKSPEKYIGRPMEITAQLREPSGAFRHPRFSRWRDDKNAEQCVWGQT